ncbi:MAG: hypothetical protein ACK587_17175 [Cyanobacteriota bacterium]|jgi:hypothetical protein
MRNLFGNYGPPEEDGPMAPGPPDRWLQWLQLGLTATLVVLFVNQLLTFRDVYSKIARLHERLDLLESRRILDTGPTLETSQRQLEERMRQLEKALRELGSESQAGPAGDREIPAFQVPPPPRMLP